MKKVLTKKELEEQLVSFKKQAEGFAVQMQQAIGAMNYVQHQLDTYHLTEEIKSDAPSNTV